MAAADIRAPSTPDALDKLGVTLFNAGDLTGAEAAYRRGLGLDPGHGSLLFDLALLCGVTGRFEEAATTYQRVLAINPKLAPVHCELGGLAHQQNRYLEAEQYYRRAIALDNLCTEAHLNLATLLLDLNRPLDAEAAMRALLARDPGVAKARALLSHALLYQGRYAEAWPLFDSRPPPPHDPPIPRWTGQSLQGKSVVLIGEQGLGDHIQFIRYAPLVKRLGARHITVIAPPPLKRLLATVEGVDEVRDDHIVAVRADYSAFLLSLPLMFGTTIETLGDTLPGGLPYLTLSPPGEPSREARAARRVGVFWAGGHRPERPATLHTDAARSMALPTLLPLLLDPAFKGRVQWTILQKDQRPAYLSVLAQSRGWSDPFREDNTGPPRDLLDTAAIISDLDLVIGVDSALIHLAAAMAKPTWMMDRWNHCWRWESGKSASAWYPEALRIFRQETLGDWAPVVGGVGDALRDWTSDPKRRTP